MRGYRGFLRELSRTGSARAFALQLRTGTRHWLRRALRRDAGGDAEALFFRNYAADGVRPPDPARRALQLAAQACLACGLCSAECARAGGRPLLDPGDAVLAGARLEIDAVRLGLAPAADACAACRACEAVCPARIPIAAVQAGLAALPRGGAAGG
jgi:Fe-S oxidoreductase